MPHASHRLDLLILPSQLDQALDVAAVAGLFKAWGVDGQGRTADNRAVVLGGCKRIWLDQPGRVILYGNQSGGFRVSCPKNGSNIAREFSVAHRRWKAGAPRSLNCPGCGERHGLEACAFHPAAAFSDWAVVFGDVGDTALMPRAIAQVKRALGETQLIMRRP